MAGDFDGEEYVGIDDDAFGSPTSQTDETTKPLSTWLENRMDGNTRFLQQRGSQVTYQFFGGEEEGIRPYTSIDQSAIFYALVPLRDDMATIDMYLLAEIDNDSATNGEVELEARLSLSGGKIIANDTATALEGSGGVKVTKLTIDVSDESIDARSGVLSLWIQSVAQSSPGSFPDVFTPETVRPYAVKDVETFQQIDATSAYIPQGEGYAIRSCHTFDNGTETWFSDFGPATESQNSAKGVTELSYILPQSLTIDISYDPEGEGEGYQRKDASTMQAQSTVLGQHTPTHGGNLDEIRSRLRPLAYGPLGEDKGDNWPTDNYRKWSWILEGSGDTIMDDQTLKLSTDDTVVYCFAHVALFRQREPSTDEAEIYYGDINSKDDELEAYNNSVTEADAQFDLTVEQLEDGDTAWANATELGASSDTYENAPVYPMTPIGGIDLATQAWFARSPDATDSVDYGWAGGTCATDYNYTFREGQVFEGDDALILPVIVSVDLSEGPNLANRADPVRATLEWGGLTNIDLPSGEQPVDDHQYHAICLQTTWLEEVPL